MHNEAIDKQKLCIVKLMTKICVLISDRIMRYKTVILCVYTISDLIVQYETGG